MNRFFEKRERERERERRERREREREERERTGREESIDFRSLNPQKKIITQKKSKTNSKQT